MSQYSSLKGTEIETVYVGYSELSGSPCVSVKINGPGNLLEQSKSYFLTAFGHL
jgi:hypothetical protein